jgi:hypothetical protein
MWAKQLSSITLRRPKNLHPYPMEEFSSQKDRASNPSSATHLLAVWPWEGYLTSLL